MFGRSCAQLLARQQSCVCDDAHILALGKFWAILGSSCNHGYEHTEDVGGKEAPVFSDAIQYISIHSFTLIYCYLLLCCNSSRSLDLQLTSKRLGGDGGRALLKVTF